MLKYTGDGVVLKYIGEIHDGVVLTLGMGWC